MTEQISRSEFQNDTKSLDTIDVNLSKERLILAKRAVQIEYSILGHPSQARIGEAYLAAMAEQLKEPAGARVAKDGKRSSSDQSNFKARLAQAYYPSECFEDGKSVSGRCPVRKDYFDDPNVLVAAHLVPFAIGGLNAAYLFGVDKDRGHESIWSINNGLILHKQIEKTLDDARLVIVPDPDALGNEFKLIVLDDNLLTIKVYDTKRTFPDLNHQRLEFKTEVRPSQRSFYLHYVLTLFRRRRFNVEGWEKDLEKAPRSRCWATPGKWL